jgi:hypothetical protein
LKQAERDAIRKSIRADIREKKLLAKAAGSPLDDPIILVQNLPDYASREKEGAVASTENLMPPPPPSMSPSSIMEANATADIEGEEEEGEENEEEDCEEGEEEEEDEKEEVDDGDESEDSLEEVEEQSDDANVRMNRLGVVANKPVNLEYERMVLQLKSVVESGDVVESDDDDDEDEDENEELPSYDQSAASPIKNISPTGTLSSLDCVMLQDEAFKNALRTLVKSTPSKEKTPEMKSFESKLAPEKCQALLWLSEYMNEIMN